MKKDFAIRLDQVFSVFNSKDTALYEDANAELKSRELNNTQQYEYLSPFRVVKLEK